jgi:hypothetical protein
MTGIVEQARFHQREYPTLIHGPLCGALADEIERLQAVIEAAKDVVCEHHMVSSTSTSASRRATIIKLREALYRLEREK